MGFLPNKQKYNYNKKSRGWFYKNRDTVILKDLPKNHISHYDLNKLTASKDALNKREEVLILTPMSKFLPEYWENINKLTYDHSLISLGFIFPRLLKEMMHLKDSKMLKENEKRKTG